MSEGMSSAELALELNARQKAFADALLEGETATAAAIKAGYAEKTAASQASRLLKNDKIAAYRRARSIENFNRMGITPEWVGTRLAEVAERCLQATPHMVWDSEAHAWAPDGDWQFDAKGATMALKAIGESLGMFKAVEREEKKQGGLAMSYNFPGGEGEEFAK